VQGMLFLWALGCGLVLRNCGVGEKERAQAVGQIIQDPTPPEAEGGA
jgi:hypothetical protein